MYILLINKNPVVSKVLSLCVRNELLELEEVESILSCRRDNYDIVFVDEKSFDTEVVANMEQLNIKKKVIFTQEDLSAEIFDYVIQKPFLPSEILDFIKSLDSEPEQPQKHNRSQQVLDNNEVEKIKELLDISEIEYDIEDEELSDEEYEIRKVEAIKEQLIAEGLEIIKEDEIIKELEPESVDDKWEDSKERLMAAKIKQNRKKSKPKKLAAKNDDLVVKAVEIAVRSLKKKQRKKLLKGKKVEITIQIEAKK